MKPSVPARRSTGRAITQRNRDAFLQALEEGTTVRDACRLIGKHHRTLYELRKVDEGFATAWDEAWEMGTQALEAEAHRRAVEGYVETTYGADGSVLRSVHRYSDALLQKLLAGRRPEVYGNQPSRVELTGRDGGPVELDPGYQPTTLRDVVALAGELGVLDALGFHRDEVDGETVDEMPALTRGDET